MKFVFTLLLVMVLISCNQNTPDSRIVAIDSNALNISDNNDIFGTWYMCATSADGLMFQKNVCLTIQFNYNGQGFVETNELNPERFSWKLNKWNMRIFYNINDGVRTFPDTNYFANFQREKDVMILTLRHKDASYFLSKQIH